MLENFLEDAFKFLTVQAVFDQDIQYQAKIFTAVNTYVYANEYGDKLGDLEELGMNFFINNSLAYADIMLNSNEQTEL